jgi:CheY-like chemotaxis protein
MEAVGQLAAGIAHDFNNLVLAIDLNVNLAMRAPDMNKQEQYCNEIKRATQRAADLTRQLLALGRRPRATLVPLDLNEAVRGMLKLLRRLIPESIEVEFLPAATIPAVNADLGQIEQVVLNLCLNARDAMPEGGKLTIATEAIDDDPSMRRSGGRGVSLTVADTGIGMTEEVRERIFEPFFTTKAPGQGTGLGLATAYAIVEHHAGRLRVDSKPGRGARFEVRLPMTSEAASGAAAAGATRSEALRGTETVLIAEDELGVRSPLVRMLEDAGYHVLVAANGEEAVQHFKEHAAKVAVVMLDVVMPRLSGPTAAQQIREIRADIPVVFASGYDQAVELAASSVEGALHLTKPYKPEVLLRKLRQAIDSQ